MSVDFFKVHVVPAYDDWRKMPSDIRLAKNLATALNNLAEHYWKLNHQDYPDKVSSTSNPKEYRDELAIKLPGFGLIRDVADCVKHLEINRNTALIRSDNNTCKKQIGFGEAFGLRFGGGEIIVAKLENGNTEYFDLFVEKVYQYWKSVLT